MLRRGHWDANFQTMGQKIPWSYIKKMGLKLTIAKDLDDGQSVLPRIQ